MLRSRIIFEIIEVVKNPPALLALRPDEFVRPVDPGVRLEEDHRGVGIVVFNRTASQTARIRH